MWGLRVAARVKPLRDKRPTIGRCSFHRSCKQTPLISRRSIMSQSVCPILSVVPTRALVDEKFKVRVENLPHGSPVTVHSLHQSEDQDYWEAFGHYISDHRGTVSVSEDLSFGGTYSGVEPMGLLWSMRPVPGSRKGLRLRKVNVCTPMLVHISVYSGHKDFKEQPPLASVLTERWYLAPGVQRVQIRDHGLVGTLFIPPGPGPFPGLLDMWGGGGGLHEYRAALLASHGYMVLALQFLSRAEIQLGDVDIDYFERAFNYVKDHPQVMPDRVGIFGLSFGSSVAVRLAAASTVINPRVCVCVSSSPAYKSAISKAMNKLTKNLDKTRVDENNCHIWLDVGRELMRDTSNLVDVEKINCPLLLVNGLDDQNWPSVEAAEMMTQRMREAGREHLLSRLEYPDAGHLIEPPYSPHFRASNFIFQRNDKKIMMLWGGQTKPHSDAQEDSWKKILSFLQQHLYDTAVPQAKL